MNIFAKLDQNFKEDMQRKLDLWNKLENQNLLQDSMIENKITCGGKKI